MGTNDILLKTFCWEAYDGNDYRFFIDIIGHAPSRGGTVVVRIPHKPWFLLNTYTQDVANIVTLDLWENMPRGISSIQKIARRNPHGFSGSDEKSLVCLRITTTNMSNYYYARKICTRQSDSGLGKGGTKSVSSNDGRYEYFMFMGKHKVQLEFDVSQTHRFQLDNNLSMHQWLKISDASEVELQTRFTSQYSIISPSQIQVVLNPDLLRSLNSNVQSASVLSYDLETFAANELAMPDPMRPTDEIYLATACFWDGHPNSEVRSWAFTHMPHKFIPQDSTTIVVQTKDEIDTILKFFELIVELNPDFIIGHNIYGFDNKYIDVRLGNVGYPCPPDFSRYIGSQCKFQSKEWSSSARKNEVISYFDCKGRLWLDTLQYTRIYYKLRSYSLKALAKEFLTTGTSSDDQQQQKIELGYKEQFKLYREKDITRTVEYGIRDAVIPILLFQKLQCWINLTSDSNIRSINIFDIYTRGQGVGVLAQEYTMAFKNDYFLAPFHRVKVTEKFKGAVVLDTIPGIWENVLHVDFAGLYPSIIMAYNLCYSTLVTDPNIPDEMCTCHNVESKSGSIRVVRFIKKEFREGILPKFLRQNKEARGAIKKQMNQVPYKSMEYNVLDARQNNIKLASNGSYGNKGSVSSKTPCYEAAEVTTQVGRDSLLKTVDFIEESYKATVIAGDSDTIHGSTPLLLMDSTTGRIRFEQIKDLIPNLKPSSPGDQQEFHYNIPETTLVWSDNGWTRIKYLMRHRNTKKMFQVLTHTGVVVVTEDHSLLSESGDPIATRDVKLGMTLMHRNLPKINISGACRLDPNVDNDVHAAWAWGFFMAEGTCGSYKRSDVNSYQNSWSVSNNDMTLLLVMQAIMNKIEPENTFIIDICSASSGVDKLSARGKNGSLKRLVDKYEALFYTSRDPNKIQNVNTTLGQRFKKVPDEILMAAPRIKLLFTKGWYAGDGSLTEKMLRCDIKGPIGAAGLYYLYASLGHEVSLNTRTDKEDIYRLNISKVTRTKLDPGRDKIKKIIPLGVLDEDVFDIETENHHFAAGIGRMVVHNSVLFTIPFMQPRHVAKIHELGVKIAKNVSDNMFVQPMSLEMEKSWTHLITLSKKNYLGFMSDGKPETAVTSDFSKSNKLFSAKGVCSVKRDTCKAVQEMFFDMCIALFKKHPPVLEVYERHLNLLPTMPYEDLAPSMGCGSNYVSASNPTNLFMNRMRDLGVTLIDGDRVEYVLVKGQAKDSLKGNRMMLLEMAVQQKLPIDYQAYIDCFYFKKAKKLIEVCSPELLPEFKAITKRYSQLHSAV